MPDISKCTGGDCPLKETCFRYLAKPSFRQSYFAEPPYTDQGCEHYWKDNLLLYKKNKKDNL